MSESSDSGRRYGLGLTEPAVRELQAILNRQHGLELSLEEAWQRAIELLEFADVLLESLPPQGQMSPPVRTSSP